LIFCISIPGADDYLVLSSTVLAPCKLGVQLTEGDMMEPEASVSAIVFHHPDARYFAV